MRKDIQRRKEMRLYADKRRITKDKDSREIKIVASSPYDDWFVCIDAANVARIYDITHRGIDMLKSTYFQ